jgi:hypothetical protein
LLIVSEFEPVERAAPMRSISFVDETSDVVDGLDPRLNSWIRSQPQPTLPPNKFLGARTCVITVPSRTRGRRNCPPAPGSPSH